MKARQWRATALGLTAVVVFAAGCGEDAADTTQAATPATEAAATSEAMVDTTEAMTETSEAMTEATGSESAAGPTGAACAAVPTSGEGSFTGMADDPAATAASNNPELSTLVTAVTAAGLVDTLNGPGPFTIFAPVNSAFAAIPAADLDGILADTELLTSILTLHVVAGEQLDAESLMGLTEVETVNGETITLETNGETLTVNGQSSVVCANIPTANATVHLIDTVLTPGA